MGEVSIRPMVAADVARINTIMNDPPGPEMAALVGDPAVATAFGTGLLELQHLPSETRPTVVAEVDGRFVGFMQYTRGALDMKISLDEIKLALRVAGPVRFVRSLPRLRARSRVDIPTPKDAFYIFELHVDPECRGQGIGGHLLDFADAEAERSGFSHLALHTHSLNRARALYERHGYVVTQVREDPTYERFTGIRGRVLMEKWLA